MPRGFTNSIVTARKAFEDLKKESLIKGKNIATRSSVAKRSGTSRTNLYAKKNLNWERLVEEIDEFAKEFHSLSNGKYKDPKIEYHKEKNKECERKYINMANQNLELLDKVNKLENIINDKQETIEILQQRLKELNR